MIRSMSAITTDPHGKELIEDDNAMFRVLVNRGDIHQFPAGYLTSHWHREFEVFVLDEGEARIGIGEQNYDLREGDGCFINSGVIHSFTTLVTTPCRYRSFVFAPEVVGGAPGSVYDIGYVRPLQEKGVPFLKLEGPTDTIYFTEFDRAFTAVEAEETAYEFRVRDALSEILLYMIEKGASVQPHFMPSVQEQRLKEMILWIDGNLSRNLTVEQIARRVNICPRECQRIFRQYLQYSPMEYVLRRRIFGAAEQLLSTDRPVTEIALDCGFASPSYFAKQFRTQMGMTPMAYRKCGQQDNFWKAQTGAL